jgi:hypothetical protein
MAIELGPPPLRDLLLTRPNEIGRQWQIWFSDIRNALATFNNEFIGHNHDERYYTKTESDSKYSLLGHVHTSGEITDFNSAVISIGDGRYSLLGHRHSILYDSALENVGLSFDASADGTFSQNVNISVDKLLSFGDSSISFDESESELVIKTIGMSDDIRIATHAQTGSIILEPGSSYGFTIIKNLTEFPSSSYSGIMVHSNGYQFYRTKTQLLSDIGASVSGHRHYQLYDSDLDELALSFDADKDGTFTGSALFATSESIGFAGTMAIPYASIGYVTDTELLIQATQTGRDVHIKAGNTGSIVLEPGAYNAVDGIIFGGASYATNIRNIWSTSSNSGVIDWVTADDEFLFHDNIKLAGTEHFYSASDSARQMIFSTAPDRGSTVGQIIWNMSGGTTEIARIEAGRTIYNTDLEDSSIDFYTSRFTASPRFSRDMRLHRGHLGIGRQLCASTYAGYPYATLHVALSCSDSRLSGSNIVSIFQNDSSDSDEADIVCYGGKKGGGSIYFRCSGDLSASNYGRIEYDAQYQYLQIWSKAVEAIRIYGGYQQINMKMPVYLESLDDSATTPAYYLTVTGSTNRIERRTILSLATDIVGSIDHGSIVGLADDDHTQYLLADGTRALTADWDAGGYEIRALTFESDVATGTAPLTIASTTVVPNLNSDTVDGINAAAMTSGRLVRYNSTGTTIETGTVAESSGALSGITTVGMSGQLTSTVATGTAPFVIDSTTVVSNLNSDLLDGQHGSYYAPAAHGVTTGYLPYANAATTWANSPLSVSGTDIVRGTVFKMTNTGMLIVGDNTVDMGPPNNLLSVQITASPSLPHTGALRCGSWLDDGQCGQFSISKALGTKDSPAAVTDGKLLGIFSFAGYAATRFRVGAYLGCYAEGKFTDSSAPARLSFNTAPSGSSSAVERFRIKSTGDCSIPADSKKLLFGAADDASILYDGTNMVFNSREVGTGHFVFSGGNVGIGATDPVSKLEVRTAHSDYWNGTTWSSKTIPDGAVSCTASRPGGYDPVFIGRAATSAGTIKTVFGIGAVGRANWADDTVAKQISDFYIVLRNNADALVERMRITSGGNVGIGTTAPDKQVEINSATGACLRLTHNDSNGSATYYTDFSVSDAGNLTIAPSGGAVFMADDVALTMGNSAADPDVIIEHDTSTNPDEFIIENTVTSENVRIKAAASGSIILEASAGGGGDGNVNIKFGSSGVCNIGETAIAYVQFDYAGNTYWDGGYPHLPVKNDTGDPAGVEGRIYINTHDNKIRCYADGAWRDLATW